MDLGDRKELSPSANLTLISVLGQWDPSFFPGCGKLIQLHLGEHTLEQMSVNTYVTMVIYQKLLPRTKKRGVFYLSLKISSLNRLASYDEYPPELCTNRDQTSHLLVSSGIQGGRSLLGLQTAHPHHTHTHTQTHKHTRRHTHTHTNTHTTPRTHTHTPHTTRTHTHTHTPHTRTPPHHTSYSAQYSQ